MASRLRHLRARALRAAFDLHRQVYEMSDGRLGANLGLPVLLLTVTGRKSGQSYSTPLVYFGDEGAYVVVGSDGGARKDPQWWKNLLVDPRCDVRVGRRVFAAEASLAQGAARTRLWKRAQVVNPAWAWYQRDCVRELPVVVLKPLGD